jgi:hypothetical protein
MRVTWGRGDKEAKMYGKKRKRLRTCQQQARTASRFDIYLPELALQRSRRNSQDKRDHLTAFLWCPRVAADKNLVVSTPGRMNEGLVGFYMGRWLTE